MKFCSQCGTQLEDSLHFCTKCGNKVKPVSNNQQVQPAPSPSVETQTESVAPLPMPNFALAIIATLHFFPLGLYALYLANKARGYYTDATQGTISDVEKWSIIEAAQETVDDVKKWSIIAIIIAAIGLIIWLFFVGHPLVESHSEFRY